jgi:hypothetical protein
MEQPTTVVFAGFILAIAAKHIWERRKTNRYPFSDEDHRR